MNFYVPCVMYEDNLKVLINNFQIRIMLHTALINFKV